MEIIAKDIAEMHTKAVRYVVSFGEHGKTEDGEAVIQAPPVTFIIENPAKGDKVADWSSFRGHRLIQYMNDVLYGTDSDFVYTYHDRLFETPCDQISSCIKRIRNDHKTRRAVAHTWIPELDNTRKDVPCLQYVQFWVDGNRLNMFVLFRSNDVLSALGANAFALTMLQAKVACACNLMVGSYTHSIVIPHLYDVRDADELKRVIK